MKTLNIGVIGLGEIGQKHCQALAGIRSAKIVAVSDINEDVLNKTAQQYQATPYQDYKDLLKHTGIEAVVVATPDDFHRDPCVAAAKAGIHILVEKPIATTEEDAQAIIDAAEEANVKLMVGFTLRFVPHYQKAKEAVQSGQLGQVISVFARRLNVISQAERINGRCGVLHFLGIHDFDVLRWIVGSEPVSIYSEASTSVERKFPHEDETFSIINFANGVVACAHIGWNLPKNHPGGRDFKLDISGNQGCLNLDLATQGVKIYTQSGHKFPSTAPGLAEEDRVFVECVLDDKPVPVTGQDGLVALRMVNAALESIEKKAVVYL
ncbi:MAG: Gfo/Idh/MocA family oxidoreductase [Chloroflexi bacterium]|nr:Gfo/Idh/MocA family oxidoreductase [Chloroflexota bacterium]